MFKRYPRWLFLAVIVSLAACSASQAAQIPLSELLTPGATFASGDKVFSNFGYTTIGDGPGADQVIVTDEGVPPNAIRFVGGFIDLPGNGPSDTLITFDVTVKEGSDLVISEVHLAANPAVFGGPGMASVTETLLPDIVNDKLVMWDFGNGDDQLADTIVLPQTYKTLSIQKGIILHSTDVEPPDPSRAVTLSFVDQMFTQVPEPTSWMLLAIGLLAVGRFRRKHA